MPSSDDDDAAAGEGGSATTLKITTRAAALSPQRALPHLNEAAPYRTEVPGQVCWCELDRSDRVFFSLRRKRHNECGAAPELTVRLDTAAVLLGDMLDDRETQSRTASVAGSCPIDAIETLEHPR